MGKVLAYQIIYFAAFSSLLPGLIIPYRWKHFKREQQWLALLVAISVIVEVAAYWIATQLKQPNTPLLHFFTPLEFGLLLQAFVVKQMVLRRTSWLLLATVVVVAIVSAFAWDDVWQAKSNTTARSLESVLLIILVLRYFTLELGKITEQSSIQPPSLATQPMFWLNVAVLLYFPASLFIFLFINWFLEPGSYSYSIFAVHAFLTIVKNVLYAIALWVKPQPSTL
ncbi:MAG: hypothetical protein AAFP77_00725 [Bacteroidota bacterium]